MRGWRSCAPGWPCVAGAFTFRSVGHALPGPRGPGVAGGPCVTGWPRLRRRWRATGVGGISAMQGIRQPPPPKRTHYVYRDPASESPCDLFWATLGNQLWGLRRKLGERRWGSATPPHPPPSHKHTLGNRHGGSQPAWESAYVVGPPRAPLKAFAPSVEVAGEFGPPSASLGFRAPQGKSAMWVSGPPARNQLGVLSPLGCFLGHFRLISTARRVFGAPPDLACGVRIPRELLRTVGPTRPRNPLGNLGPFFKAP